MSTLHPSATQVSGWRPAPVEPDARMLEFGVAAAGLPLRPETVARIWTSMMSSVPELFPKVRESSGSQVQAYDVRAGREWGTFCLRDWRRVDTSPSGERTTYGGELLVHSSFGNWAYTWHACGMPFKEFLADCDRDYLMGKLLGDKLRTFDGELSVRELRKELLQKRRTWSLTREMARASWDAIKRDESTLAQSAEDFVSGCQSIADRLAFDATHGAPGGCIDDSWREIFSEPWEWICRSVCFEAKSFWDKLWPEFLAALQRDQQGAQA